MLKINNLKCEGMRNPLGIDIKHPRLTWSLESDKRNTIQEAYQVIVSTCPEEAKRGKGDFYDSGKLKKQEPASVVGRPVYQGSTRLYWAVRVWDNHGEISEWSEVQWFESGLLTREDWVAKWIEPIQRPVFTDNIRALYTDTMSTNHSYTEIQRIKDTYRERIDESKMNPCPMIRKDFKVAKKVKCARAYATAHGIYRLEINGMRVGDLEFMPEATSYDKYLQYQTYDVTGLLIQGDNAVGATLSDGWWAGRLGAFGESCNYGNTLALLAQINIEYEDGTVEKIGTDKTFLSFEGPTRFADLFIGEKYDARLERVGWSCAGYPKGNWQFVNECDYDMDVLVGQNAEPIRVVKTVKPIRIYTSPKGETIVDFGQIMSGNSKFTLKGRKGQEVVFSYSEQTDKDGNYNHGFLGNKQHEDYYIFKGSEEEIYDPKFTYRGFRYIRVTGYDGELELDKIEGRLIASDVEFIGNFKCSDERLNQLQSNIQWTLIGNVMSIPTDNPDRERAGWTGDGGMIASTMVYNLGVQAFFKRWMREHVLEQMPDGKLPMVVPGWKSYADVVPEGIAGWGDDCIIVPWAVYSAYGDVRILKDNYDMMKKWMAYVIRRAASGNPEDIGVLTPEREENLNYIWNIDFQYGDWMTPAENFDKNGKWRYASIGIPDFTPCFYTKYSADLLSKIAEVLGKEEDAIYYKALSDSIRKAVIAEFFDSGYILNSSYQGVPVLALKMGLVPEDKRQATAHRLVELIEKDGGKLNTGFTSAEHLLGVLVDSGKTDVAYDLLFQDEMPSWLYQIKNGATGIWETWQNIMPDGSMNEASFIQYAIGNVGKWIYSTIGGIDMIEPGYKRIRIAPVLDPKDRITSAEGSLNSPYGKIVSMWEKVGRHMTINVSIPVSTTAEIVLPGVDSVSAVNKNGTVLGTSAKLCEKDGSVMVSVGSGDYSFKYDLA